MANANLDFNKIEEPSKATNVNLVDDLEEAFQGCIHALTKDEAGFDDDSCAASVRQEVEQTTTKFIDLARQIEVFFLQKRFIVLNTSPELLLKEENSELRHEIQRKDDLLRKHFEKLDAWRQLLHAQDQQTPQRPGVGPGGVVGPQGVGGPSGMPVGVGGPGGGPGIGMPGIPPGMSPQQQQGPGPGNPMMMGGAGPQQGMMGVPGPVPVGHPGGPPPNPQMFMQQNQMRPNFNQGPLDYLLKTTNNIDSVGLGDGRR